MNLLSELIEEIVGMFVADALLTAATLILVGIVAGLLYAGVPGTWCGLLLLAGTMAIIVGAVRRASGKRRAAQR